MPGLVAHPGLAQSQSLITSYEVESEVHLTVSMGIMPSGVQTIRVLINLLCRHGVCVCANAAATSSEVLREDVSLLAWDMGDIGGLVAKGPSCHGLSVRIIARGCGDDDVGYDMAVTTPVGVFKYIV